MAVLQQLGGNPPPNGTRSRNRYPHQCSSGPLSMAAMTWEASFSGHDEVGDIAVLQDETVVRHHGLAQPGEERDLGADLLEVVDLDPTHASGIGTTAIRTMPDGSRHSGSEPSGAAAGGSGQPSTEPWRPSRSPAAGRPPRARVVVDPRDHVLDPEHLAGDPRGDDVRVVPAAHRQQTLRPPLYAHS